MIRITQKKCMTLFLTLFIIFLLINNVKAKESKIEYTSLVNSLGWQEIVYDGELSGTEGKAKGIESLKITLNQELQGEIEYISYMQTYGWENNWKKNGEETGRPNEHKRIEAIRIRLVGSIESEYDIYYRVHSQTYGWLGWAKNGETAGTLGMAKRMEAIEIKLVEKGTGEETRDSYLSNLQLLSYQGHSQTYGWLPSNEQNIIGTIGKGKRLEAYKLSLEPAEYTGKIEYMSYIENIGWEDNWKSNNEISGTVGKAKKIEQIKIKLVGEAVDYYDIYYRVHVQNYGWLGWAKNGEESGTIDLNFRIEAIEIKLVEKGTGEETGNSTIKKSAYAYYETYISENEALGEVAEREISGTTGQAKAIRAFRARVDSSLSGSIIYQTYNKEMSWPNEWTNSNEISGYLNTSKTIQAIKINLTEELAEQYDIYYCVHLSQFGWLGWAKNGEIAGSNEYNIEAIEIRLYLKIDSNKNYLERNNYYIEKKVDQPTYYNQYDPRWANIYYGNKKMGASGCTPTSLAMAFTGILKRQVLPTEVADYLYYHTNEFNRKVTGCSGMAIIYASQFYGIKYTALHSEEDIKKALLRGKIIYAAMGNGKYATPRWNHAIIFFDYNKGNTFVYDPLNTNNNGWESINRLWIEQSKDSDDSRGGSNFYSLEIY